MKSVWLAMIVTGCCLGQAPLSTEKVSVSGSVISAAGEPLRRVTLRLNPVSSGRGSSIDAPVSNFATETDLQGNFAFDEVLPGRYLLNAERTGYLNAYYTNARGTVLTIKPGQKTGDILIKMAPQGIIAGRVLDDEKEPLPGATVTVRMRSIPGQFQGMELPGTTATTDADGAFAIGGLGPARYVVSVAAPQRLASPAKSPPARTNEDTYVTTYYSDATDLAQATAVEVGRGAQVRGLEIRLQRVPVFSIRGKVVNAAAGEAGAPDVLTLTRQGSTTPGLSAKTTGVIAGEFSFEEVLPGTYILEARPIETQGHLPLVGYQIVTVGNADLERVVVEMKPGIELSGKVVVDGAPPASWPQITLTPTDGLNYLASPMVDAEGRLLLLGLEPAHYRVNVGSLLPPLFVKSVRFNGLDVAGDIDLSSASTASLEIAISYGTSSISGVVSDSEGPVGPAVTIMATRKNQGPFLTTQTDENGRFSMAGLPGGDYFLVAMDMGAARLPAESVERLGKTVTVEEGATVTADLRLTTSDDLPGLDSH